MSTPNDTTVHPGSVIVIKHGYNVWKAQQEPELASVKATEGEFAFVVEVLEGGFRVAQPGASFFVPLEFADTDYVTAILMAYGWQNGGAE